MRQIELRAFTEEEYHVFFREYQPDLIMDPSSSPFVYNYEQVSRSYRYNYGGFRDHYIHYGVFMDQRPVGSLQLKRINDKEKSCEIGIILQNESIKDLGIGTEAIRMAIQKAIHQLGLEYMIGDTLESNKRMIRVFEKLGFQLKERIPDAFRLSDGRKTGRLVYIKRITEAD